MQIRSRIAVTLGCLATLLLVAGAYAGPGLSLDGQPRSAGQVSWPQILLVPVATGLLQPTYVTNAGDGTGRLFLVERHGVIRIMKDGALLPTPFLDISERVGIVGSEQGLLSIAFPPEYEAKGHFYVDYTDLNGDTVVARFSITPSPDVADPASEQVVLAVGQPFRNHNGGQLAFGPRDGYLYIGMGDGGAGGDPGNRAQDPSLLLGKLLRIDVETGNPITYTIPQTNPFTQTVGFRGEIWSLGLRNPWRFSFDSKTGDLYIADVGQNLLEEVNFQPASSPGGENYGWRILEGSRCFNPATDCVEPDNYSPPVAEYDRDSGCAITGGYVNRGVYFFSDFCSGRIWGLVRHGTDWTMSLLHEAGFGATTFGEGEDGSLYIADYFGGIIYRIDSTWKSHFPLVIKGS